MNARTQAGLSIVEVMVGLMVGILVTLSAWGSVMFYEANRRSGVGGNSALENAMASALAIQRDVKAAGLGFVFAGMPACGTMNVFHDGVATADGSAIAPVTIVDGGAASEQISVAYSGSILGGAPVQTIAAMANPGDLIRVNSTGTVSAGDMVLIASALSTEPCTLAQVTTATAAAFGTELTRAAGRWNPANPGGTFANAPSYGASSSVIRADGFTWVTYRISNNAQLEVVNNVTSQVDVLAENVVLLKAQYGTSNGSTPQIEQWTNATEAWAPPLDAAHVQAVRAIRIVVVARAPHREKPSAGSGPCDATTVAPTAWPGGPAIDLSADPDWQCYRYKTLMLTIPLKNMIFGGQA
jgi:type IV pilus assembly protein PilW